MERVKYQTGNRSQVRKYIYEIKKMLFTVREQKKKTKRHTYQRWKILKIVRRDILSNKLITG